MATQLQANPVQAAEEQAAASKQSASSVAAAATSTQAATVAASSDGGTTETPVAWSVNPENKSQVWDPIHSRYITVAAGPKAAAYIGSLMATPAGRITASGILSGEDTYYDPNPTALGSWGSRVGETYATGASLGLTGADANRLFPATMITESPVSATSADLIIKISKDGTISESDLYSALQKRKDYQSQESLGDSTTQAILANWATAQKLLSTAGIKIASPSASQVLEYQREAAIAKAGGVETTVSRYYGNELQKAIQQNVAISSEYHHMKDVMPEKYDIAYEANPYEYAGDKALILLKGQQELYKGQLEKLTPDYTAFMKTVPSREGVQGYYWDVALATDNAKKYAMPSSPSFMAAIKEVEASQGILGPYAVAGLSTTEGPEGTRVQLSVSEQQAIQKGYEGWWLGKDTAAKLAAAGFAYSSPAIPEAINLKETLAAAQEPATPLMKTIRTSSTQPDMVELATTPSVRDLMISEGGYYYDLGNGRKMWITKSAAAIMPITKEGILTYGMPGTEDNTVYDVQKGQIVTAPKKDVLEQVSDIFTMKETKASILGTEIPEYVQVSTIKVPTPYGMWASLERANPYVSDVLKYDNGLLTKYYLQSPETKGEFGKFVTGLAEPIYERPVTTAGEAVLTYALMAGAASFIGKAAPVVTPYIEAAPGGSEFLKWLPTAAGISIIGVAGAATAIDVANTAEDRRAQRLGSDITTLAITGYAGMKGYSPEFSVTKLLSPATESIGGKASDISYTLEQRRLGIENIGIRGGTIGRSAEITYEARPITEQTPIREASEQTAFNPKINYPELVGSETEPIYTRVFSGADILKGTGKVQINEYGLWAEQYSPILTRQAITEEGITVLGRGNSAFAEPTYSTANIMAMQNAMQYDWLAPQYSGKRLTTFLKTGEISTGEGLTVAGYKETPLQVANEQIWTKKISTKGFTVEINQPGRKIIDIEKEISIEQPSRIETIVYGAATEQGPALNIRMLPQVRRIDVEDMQIIKTFDIAETYGALGTKSFIGADKPLPLNIRSMTLEKPTENITPTFDYLKKQTSTGTIPVEGKRITIETTTPKESVIGKAKREDWLWGSNILKGTIAEGSAIGTFNIEAFNKIPYGTLEGRIKSPADLNKSSFRIYPKRRLYTATSENEARKKGKRITGDKGLFLTATPEIAGVSTNESQKISEIIGLTPGLISLTTPITTPVTTPDTTQIKIPSTTPPSVPTTTIPTTPPTTPPIIPSLPTFPTTGESGGGGRRGRFRFTEVLSTLPRLPVAKMPKPSDFKLDLNLPKTKKGRSRK